MLTDGLCEDDSAVEEFAVIDSTNITTSFKVLISTIQYFVQSIAVCISRLLSIH